MYEKFKEPKLDGSINVRMSDDKGYWTSDKRVVLTQIRLICLQYKDQGYSLTLRQLYYQLVSKDYIPNHDKVYKKLSMFKAGHFEFVIMPTMKSSTDAVIFTVK